MQFIKKVGPVKVPYKADMHAYVYGHDVFWTVRTKYLPFIEGDGEVTSAPGLVFVLNIVDCDDRNVAEQIIQYLERQLNLTLTGSVKMDD